MRKISEYFFPLEDDESLSVHDATWFFGILGGAIVMTLIVLVVTL